MERASIPYEPDRPSLETDDAGALAGAIERLLRDRALGKQLGLAARARVSDAFDNDRNLEVLMDLLETHDGCGKHYVAA